MALTWTAGLRVLPRLVPVLDRGLAEVDARELDAVRAAFDQRLRQLQEHFDAVGQRAIGVGLAFPPDRRRRDGLAARFGIVDDRDAVGPRLGHGLVGQVSARWPCPPA